MLRGVGKPVQAKQRYEEGLILCAGEPELVVTLNLCVAAGDVSMELKQLEDAEGYFVIADQVASKLANPFVKTDCMEKLGVIHQTRGKVGQAVRLWRDAADICRQFEYNHRLSTLLEHLREAFANANMTNDLRQAEAELKIVEKRLRGAPA